MFKQLGDIDWTTWQAQEKATLLFVIQNEKILLIHKKRGLGRGKINGPGGRLEPGETPQQAAVREVIEEVGVTPTGVVSAGELLFQFCDGYSLHGYVFTASGYEGELIETDEARPEWFPLDQIPFDRMWPDDRHWFPLMLAGQSFHGRFIFDGDRMLDHVIVTRNPHGI